MSTLCSGGQHEVVLAGAEGEGEGQWFPGVINAQFMRSK